MAVIRQDLLARQGMGQFPLVCVDEEGAKGQCDGKVSSLGDRIW